MSQKVDTLRVINDELKRGLKLEKDVGEETVLAEVGVTSMYLITLVVTLKRKYGMNLDGFVKRGMPNTIGDLLRTLEDASDLADGVRS